MLSPKEYEINEYEHYYPVTTRNLADTNTTSTTSTKEELPKELDNKILKIAIVLALVGGFNSFLRLVFGMFLSIFTTNLKVADFINTIKMVRFNQALAQGGFQGFT